MPPIISIVGKSDSGKTTLLEKLISEFRKRGYRVGTIKHDTHGFEVDHEGKDSWRHKQAGAATVAIASPFKVAVIKDIEEEKSLDLLVTEYFQDVDIIFTEGYKRESKLKVEVFRKEMHRELLCTDDENLIALASNQPFDIKAPCFDINDVKGLTDLIETKFLKVRQPASVSLVMDDKYIPLKPFIQEMFVNTITGMVAALKGGKGARSIQVSITLSEE
ncbi:MAG: molybdopterin-guanine dinucleotide biosynthesis protein B [Pseudomonadota bacterium]